MSQREKRKSSSVLNEINRCTIPHTVDVGERIYSIDIDRECWVCYYYYVTRDTLIYKSIRNNIFSDIEREREKKKICCIYVYNGI